MHEKSAAQVEDCRNPECAPDPPPPPFLSPTFESPFSNDRASHPQGEACSGRCALQGEGVPPWFKRTFYGLGGPRKVALPPRIWEDGPCRATLSGEAKAASRRRFEMQAPARIRVRGPGKLYWAI